METNDPNQLELDAVTVAPAPDNRGGRPMDQAGNAGPAPIEPNGNRPARTRSRRSMAKKQTRVSTPGVDIGTLEPLLTYKQAALALGASPRTIRRLVDEGKIAITVIRDGMPRIRPSDLRQYIDESVVKYTKEDSEGKS
jgi:excisionase family DNA binding protein